jgi:hypothetical protein
MEWIGEAILGAVLQLAILQNWNRTKELIGMTMRAVLRKAILLL